MPFLQGSLAILAVLMVNIVISEQLDKLPYFRAMGTSLIVIIVIVIRANLGLIPASTNVPPIYVLGIISRFTYNTEAFTATTIGVIVVVRMIFSSQLPDT